MDEGVEANERDESDVKDQLLVLVVLIRIAEADKSVKEQDATQLIKDLQALHCCVLKWHVAQQVDGLDKWTEHQGEDLNEEVLRSKECDNSEH